MNGIILYLIIFFAKIVEVSLMTVRVVLINKGERKIGAMIGFVEVSIWAIVVSNVLSGLTEDPFKIVVYALGYSLGTFFGSMIEEKLAIGNTQVTVVIDETENKELIEILRSENYAITVLNGEGMDSNKSILMIMIKRKKIKELTNRIKEINNNAVIAISDTKPINGGYGMLKK